MTSGTAELPDPCHVMSGIPTKRMIYISVSNGDICEENIFSDTSTLLLSLASAVTRAGSRDLFAVGAQIRFEVTDFGFLWTKW